MRDIAIQAAFTVKTVTIRSLKTSCLQPSGRISPRRLKALCHSIEVDGLKLPPVIDRHRNIIDGHRRIEAARELGVKSIQCIVLTDDVASTLTIALNAGGVTRSWNGRDKLESWQRSPKSFRDAVLETVGASCAARIRELINVFGVSTLERLVRDNAQLTPSYADGIREIYAVLGKNAPSKAIIGKWLIQRNPIHRWFAQRKAKSQACLNYLQHCINADESIVDSLWTDCMSAS